MNRDNTNTGVLFKNDKQGNDRRPDYKGKINVNGTEFWLSAWIKSSRDGNKYMSLSVQDKRGSDDRRPERSIASGNGDKAAQQMPYFDDEIPF